MKIVAAPRQYVTKIGAGGRVVIPTDMRRALDLQPGDDVVLILEESGLKILSPLKAVAQAQGLVRQYVEEGRSLSEELIAERREERNGT